MFDIYIFCDCVADFSPLSYNYDAAETTKPERFELQAPNVTALTRPHAKKKRKGKKQLFRPSERAKATNPPSRPKTFHGSNHVTNYLGGA